MFVFAFEGALLAFTVHGERFALFALLPRRNPRTERSIAAAVLGISSHQPAHAAATVASRGYRGVHRIFLLRCGVFHPIYRPLRGAGRARSLRFRFRLFALRAFTFRWRCARRCRSRCSCSRARARCRRAPHTEKGSQRTRRCHAETHGQNGAQRQNSSSHTSYMHLYGYVDFRLLIALCSWRGTGCRPRSLF